MKSFRRIDVQAIKRELNTRADQLAKGAAYGEYDQKSKLTTANDHLPDVNMVEAMEDSKSNLIEESWMDPIIHYLKNGREIRIKPENYELRLQDIHF